MRTEGPDADDRELGTTKPEVEDEPLRISDEGPVNIARDDVGRAPARSRYGSAVDVPSRTPCITPRVTLRADPSWPPDAPASSSRARRRRAGSPRRPATLGGESPSPRTACRGAHGR